MEMGEDKLWHLIIGFTLSCLGILWVKLFCAGFIFGIAKEVYDHFSKSNTPEFWDVIATWIGACGALIFMIL